MSRIYTLKNSLSGDAAVMNGKIFKGKIDDHNQITFIDITNNQILRQTTSVVERVGTDYGIIITTKSGSIYDLIDVTKIIPTAIHDEPKVLLPIDVNTIRSISIDRYRYDKDTIDCINILSSDFNITNIGELERAIIHTNLLGNIHKRYVGHVNSIIKAAGFKIENVDDKIKLTFEGFDKFINTEECQVIGHIHSVRHANYCDAWNSNEFIFTKKVTEEQFKEFCIANNLRIVEQSAWYMSYSKLEKNNLGNRSWIHKWIDPYTD